MGLETRDFSKGRFLNISEGKIIHKDEKGEKHQHTGITGVLTAITFRDGDDAKFGPETHLHIIDNEDQKWILQMRTSSGYSMAFMKAIENCNLSQPITFAPWYQVKDDVKKGGLNILQDNKQIQWKYTRETPNGLPDYADGFDSEGKPIKLKFPQVKWLKEMLERVIIPALQMQPQPSAIEHDDTVASTIIDQGVQGDMEEDDLPF